MPKAKTSLEEKSSRKIRPAMTPEARENQLIALATDLAEKRLIEGTASSSEIVHFLKLASTKNELEKEKLKKENELAQAKIEALQSTKHIEELYADAIKAMKGYAGQANEESEDEY